MRFEHDTYDIDVYSLCESVYYSCNNDEYDYVLECVNNWIYNDYNDNILLEDIILNEYTDEGLAKKLGFSSVDQMYNFHSDWYSSKQPYSDAPWDEKNLNARKAFLINQHLSHRTGDKEISKDNFQNLRYIRGPIPNAVRFARHVAKNNGYSNQFLQNLGKNLETPSMKGMMYAGKDAIALTIDSIADIMVNPQTTKFYSRTLDDFPLPLKIKSGLKKIFRNALSIERARRDAKNLLKGHLTLEQKAQLAHYMALKVRATDISNIGSHIQQNTSKIKKTLSSALSKLGMNSTDVDVTSQSVAGLFGASQHIAQQLAPDLQKIASMNSNNSQIQKLSNTLKTFGNLKLDNQHMNKLIAIQQRVEQVLGNHNIDLKKILKNDPKAIEQLKHKLDMFSIDNIKTPTQAMAIVRSLSNTASNLSSQITGTSLPKIETSPTPLEDRKGRTIKKLDTGFKGRKFKPQQEPPLTPGTAAAAQPGNVDTQPTSQQLILPEIDRSKIPDASPVVTSNNNNQSRLSRATTWMKNNKVKGGLGVVAAGAAIGGSIYAYKRFKNRPKSVIAKRIQALRGIYHKFMINAQRNPQKANLFKRVAAKILSVIDKLLQYLQNKADGR